MTIRKPFFVVPLDFAMTTYASGPVAGYPQSNLRLLDHLGLVWRHNAADGVGFFSGDFGSAKEIDFFAMLNTSASSSTTYNMILRSGPAPDGPVVFLTDIISFLSTTEPNPFGRTHSFYECSAVQSARYFNLNLYHPSGIFEASHLVVGKKIEFDHFYDRGFGMGFDLKGGFQVGRNGVPDISDGAVLRTLRFAMSTMTKSDFHNKFQPLIAAIKSHKPVYICFDPQADTYRNSNTYFGVLEPPPFATIGALHPEWYSQEFDMLSQI